jgi:adenylyl cyclase-associated protein
VEWVQAFYAIFKELEEYIKDHYAGGVTWNNQGIDAADALKQANTNDVSAPPAPPSPSAGGPPPPPPPPPPLPVFDVPVTGGTTAGGDMNEVFNALNQGENVTKGLKKVDPSQMTHKNPSLRATAPVPTRSDSGSSIRGKSPAPPGKKPKPQSMRTKKPPKKELEGNKWLIENFEGEQITLDNMERNQSILVTNCKSTTIQVKGKANAISVDSSTSLSLIIDSLVSSVDVIKSPKFALQVLGTLPTILMDQVDGATVYLSKDSLAVEIFTSKCANVNINVPEKTDDADEDFVERAVPEQFKSVVKNGVLVSEIVEHAG